MSKVEITVPQMGESISEATVGQLIAASGSQVAMDAELLELETDKVNQVLYAPTAGQVTYTVNEGDVVTVGQVLGHVDGAASAEAPEAAPKSEAPAEAPPASATKPTAASSEPQTASTPSGSVRVTAESFLQDLKQGNAAPAAQAATTTEKAAPSRAQAAPAPSVAAVAAPVSSLEHGERESRKRMPRIRQVIAERLVEAQHSTAMLTTFNECDMSAVMKLRKEHQDRFVDKHGVKLGFMSIFVKAVVSALKAVPAVNSYIDGAEFVQRHYYDVGIAVGTERGLIVPVVRDCDRLNFAGIEKAIANYAQQARDGSISLDDLQGGGFTITNGGIYGSLLSTPILNPPQCGILGMHSIQKRPMVVNDEIVIRPMMYLALSYDHRIVDGKEAVTFLVHVKQCIENPASMLLDI